MQSSSFEKQTSDTAKSSFEVEIETKEILKRNLEALIQLEKEHQEKLKKENENLLDYSKEMIHDVTTN